MVQTCCVDSCNITKRPNVVFHRFPFGDPERLRQWLETLNMDVNTPLHALSKLFVCQKHFHPDDYYDVHQQLTRRARLLKTTAVPTQLLHMPDPTDTYLVRRQQWENKRKHSHHSTEQAVSRSCKWFTLTGHFIICFTQIADESWQQLWMEACWRFTMLKRHKGYKNAQYRVISSFFSAQPEQPVAFFSFSFSPTT